MQMFKRITFFILLITSLFSCDEVKEVIAEDQQLTIEDIKGQWSLIRVDTIETKQSLEVNKTYRNWWMEYERSSIEQVDGILKCVSLCPNSIPEKDMEFSSDSVFEYVFPTHVRSFNQLKIVDNQIELKGINSIWSGKTLDTGLEVKLNHDTLRIEYLEETGLYLSEVYKRNLFDQELVDFLRAYGHNLPLAEGKYAIVHYEFHTVDYDSPFEHYHSFPHDVPETLDFSKEDLLQILKDEYEFQMLTDGQLKPYNLSWSWGDRFWISPKEWYDGPDTSAYMIFDKVK